MTTPTPTRRGPKTKSPTGEAMKARPMRWTDAGWADVLLIGTDRVRELVAREAARVRRQQAADDQRGVKDS